MATYSLRALISGFMQPIPDTDTGRINTLSIGASGNSTDLTKTILDNLITLQNGSDIAASLHHHDSRYFTETELSSTTDGSSGADLIGMTPVGSGSASTIQGVMEEQNALISALESGYSRRTKVIDYVDNTAVPPTEVSGDRYILDFTVGTLNAAWDGASKGDIVEFNGTSWIATTPVEGYVVYVDSQDKDYLYVDDGTPAWEARSTQNTALSDGKIWIGDSSGQAAERTVSGDVTISNTGVAAISSGVIVNDDVNASAGIVESKLALDYSTSTLNDAIALNTTHRTSDGTDHTYIDQDVTIGSSPTFDGTNISGIITGDVDTLHFLARKSTAGTIAAGTPVYIVGYDATNGLVTVEAADASDPAKMPAVGVAEVQLDATTYTNFVTLSGDLSGIDTSSFTAGDELYVAAGGGFTTTKPTGTNLIQKIAEVSEAAVAGQLIVFGAGRTNDVPNIADGSFWLGNASGVATPTVFDTAVGSATAVAANTAHAATVTGNPHQVTKAEVLTGDLIVNADVDAAAAIVESKLSLDYSTSSLNSAIIAHVGDTTNPHSVTAAQVGLGNVTNEAALPLTGGTMTGAIDMGSNKITSTYVPVDDADVVNKLYADSIASGLDPKESARIATTADLSGTYSSTGGTAGSGAFTAVDLTSAAIFDGLVDADSVSITLQVGDRILVKNQTNAAENGIYVVTTAGATGAIERATDHDGNPGSEISGGNYIFVENGTVNSNAGWVLVGDGVLTLNTDDIIWVQYTGTGQITAGIGLSKTGSTFNVNLGAGITELPSDEIGIDLATDGGLELTSQLTGGQLQAKVNTGTMEITASGIGVKAGGIAEAQLSSAVDAQSFDSTHTAVNYTPSAVGAEATTQISAHLKGIDNALATAGGKRDLVAGEAFAANTTFAVRWALTGETAGRFYKAEKASAATNQEFWAFGYVMSTTAVSAGDTVEVTVEGGEHTLGSNDTAFAAAENGLPIYLGAAGAFDVWSQLTFNSGDAQYSLGLVKDANTIYVSGRQMHGTT